MKSSKCNKLFEAPQFVYENLAQIYSAINYGKNLEALLLICQCAEDVGGRDVAGPLQHLLSPEIFYIIF